MNDDELDHVLDHDARVWESSITTATTTLVYAARQHVEDAVSPRRRPRRAGVLIGSIVAGAALLTAGASVTAAQLGIPPFQTTELGVVRIPTAVPISYKESTGTTVKCLAFMEFENIDNATQSLLMKSIATHDWEGLGQTAYDEAHGRGGDQIAKMERFSQYTDTALYAVAKSAVPLLQRQSTVMSTGGATPASSGVLWTGSSMSCSPQNNW